MAPIPVLSKLDKKLSDATKIIERKYGASFSLSSIRYIGGGQKKTE
jgi:hypothetical protein